MGLRRPSPPDDACFFDHELRRHDDHNGQHKGAQNGVNIPAEIVDIGSHIGGRDAHALEDGSQKVN